MTIDLVVANGTLVLEDGPIEADLGVDDGTIVAVGRAAGMPDADEVIDVSGRHVLPGIIDSHVHFREPGYTEKEDFETGTRAAARGGVTLAVDMPNCDPMTDTAERLREKRALAESKACIDFGHNPSGHDPDAIAELADAGAFGIKQFMIEDTERGYPHMPGLGTRDLRHLLEIVLATGETGRPLMVHPHSQQIAEYAQEQLWDTHGRDYRAYMEWYCSLDWLPILEAVSSLIELATATGTHVHVLHAKWARGFDLVRDARRRGVENVTLEVNPASLFLTWDDIANKVGPYGLGSAVPDVDREATWAAIRDGTVDVIASDHSPQRAEEKAAGWEDMWEAPGGKPEIEFYVPQLLDAVNEGRLSVERLVEVCSINPARLFGVYPRKGSLQVGTDADLTVVDLDREWEITLDDVHSKVGWTPYQGRQLTADVVATIVRGRPVMLDGEVIDEPGYGAFVRPDYPGSLTADG